MSGLVGTLGIFTRGDVYGQHTTADRKASTLLPAVLAMELLHPSPVTFAHYGKVESDLAPQETDEIQHSASE